MLIVYFPIDKLAIEELDCNYKNLFLHFHPYSRLCTEKKEKLSVHIRNQCVVKKIY